MPRKPIDLAAVRYALGRLDRLLAEHPELREPSPDRQQALEEWLETLDEESKHATESTDDR